MSLDLERPARAPNRARRCLGGLALTTVLTGCPSPSSMDAGVHEASHCESADEAPIRNGQGGFNCVHVGADGTPTSSDWPDVMGLPTPIAYVSAGASGGDGSMARPYGSIAEARAMMPTARGIAVARGRYTVDSSIAIADIAGLEIRGAGPSQGTVLVPAASIEALGITGGAADVTIAGLSIEYPPPATGQTNGSAVHVTGNALVTLRNVRIDYAGEGVLVDGSRLVGERLTVTHAGDRGVSLARDMSNQRSDAQLTNVLVSEGSLFGIVVDESHIAIADSGILHNVRDGLAILGGDPTVVNTVDRVSVQCDGVTGMRVERAGAEVRVNLLAASGTIVPTGTVGGDGLYVGPGAHVVVDADVNSDAQRATRSEFVANARAGVLVNAEAGNTADNLELRGALIGSNQSTGVYVQNSAHVSLLGYSTLDQNLGAGLAVTSAGVVAGVQCDAFTGTRAVSVVTSAGAVTIGDGISLGEGTSASMTQLSNNEISGNERYGALISDVNANLTGNHGTGNRYGIGVYGSASVTQSTNDVGSREGTPAAVPPSLRGTLIGSN